jgi:hypothetical protein
MELAIIKVPPITNNTLGFPFKKKGKWFYEAEGHKGARNITEGIISYPQRFVIDSIFVDDVGHFTNDTITQNKNWNTYGIELVAIADGTVVAVKNEI